jgi:hypothetical protein
MQASQAPTRRGAILSTLFGAAVLAPPAAAKASPALQALYQQWATRNAAFEASLAAMADAEARAEFAKPTTAELAVLRVRKQDREPQNVALGLRAPSRQWAPVDLPAIRNRLAIAEGMQAAFPEQAAAALRCRNLASVLQSIEARQRALDELAGFAPLHEQTRRLGGEVANLERRIADWPARSPEDVRLKAKFGLALSAGEAEANDAVLLRSLCRDLLAA